MGAEALFRALTRRIATKVKEVLTRSVQCCGKAFDQAAARSWIGLATRKALAGPAACVHPRGARHPAAFASSTEQNMRSPAASSMVVRV